MNTLRGYYFALTTHGGGSWWVVGEGESKDELREAAERAICGDEWDRAKSIRVDTELKNLVIVSRSRAQRKSEWRRAVENRYES